MPLNRRGMLALLGCAFAGALGGCAVPVAGAPVRDPAIPGAPGGDRSVVVGSDGRALTIFCAAGSDLIAVDAATGGVRWTAQLTEYSSLQGAAAVGPDGLYCLDDSGYLSRWSLQDGRQLGRIRIGSDGLSDTVPLVLDGQVFVDNWDGDVVVLDAATLRQARWTYVGANYIGGGSPQNALCCLDAGSGSLIWLSAVRGQIGAAPTAVTDRGVVMAYGGSF